MTPSRKTEVWKLVCSIRTKLHEWGWSIEQAAIVDLWTEVTRLYTENCELKKQLKETNRG